MKGTIIRFVTITIHLLIRNHARIRMVMITTIILTPVNL